MPRPKPRNADDQPRARKRNAELFVPVTAVNLRTAPVADVATLDALVEIAKKYETMILELPRGEHADYLLWDGGMVFRHRAGPPDESEPAGAAAPLKRLRRTDRVAGPTPD